MHVRPYVRQVTPQSLDDIAQRCQRPRRRPVFNPTVVMPDLDRHALNWIGQCSQIWMRTEFGLP